MGGDVHQTVVDFPYPAGESSGELAGGLPYRAAAETGDMTAAMEAAPEAGIPGVAVRNERLAAGRAALTRALCAPGKEKNV